MTADELFAEAQQLARPCFYLYEGLPRSGEAAGVWGGTGIIPLDAPRHRHWITLNCQVLTKDFDDLHLTGAMSIYSDDEKCEGGTCVFDPKLTSLPVDNEAEEEDDFDDEDGDEEDDDDDEGAFLSRSPLCTREGTSLPSFCQLL